MTSFPLYRFYMEPVSDSTYYIRSAGSSYYLRDMPSGQLSNVVTTSDEWSSQDQCDEYCEFTLERFTMVP